VKNFLIIFILYFSIYSLDAQNHFYDQYNSTIKKQQIDILKKESVKKITKSFHQYQFNKIGHIADEFVTLDTIGNVLNIIYQNNDTKKTFSYTYNTSNSLSSEIRTIKKGRFKAKNDKGEYKYAKVFSIAYNRPTTYDKLYYTYDNKNRLIKKKSCVNNSSCKFEITKYIKKKIYTSYLNTYGDLEYTKMREKKDSIEIELTTNKCDKIPFKSVTFYNKDSLKLKEEHFTRDTLTYREINKIENNRIVQTIKTYYFKKQNSNEKTQSIRGNYFIYNKDSNLQTLIYMWNDSEGRYEYKYNEKGLLVTFEEYKDNKLRKTTQYKYDYY
jgi:hypothetical protein